MQGPLDVLLAVYAAPGCMTVSLAWLQAAMEGTQPGQPPADLSSLARQGSAQQQAGPGRGAASGFGPRRGSWGEPGDLPSDSDAASFVSAVSNLEAVAHPEADGPPATGHSPAAVPSPPPVLPAASACTAVLLLHGLSAAWSCAFRACGPLRLTLPTCRGGGMAHACRVLACIDACNSQCVLA